MRRTIILIQNSFFSFIYSISGDSIKFVVKIVFIEIYDYFKFKR